MNSILRLLVAFSARATLEEALAAAGVKVRLCKGCLQELVQDADAVAWQLLKAASVTLPYPALLREQLAERARFVWLWTESDTHEFQQSWTPLVRIARKYALPRAWKLSEPPAPACRNAHFSVWKWASGTA